MKNVFKCFIVVGFLFFIIPKTAYAYLDAGTGSQILQIAIAAVVGGLFVIKIFFRQIKEFFRKLFSKIKKQWKII